MTAVSSWPLVTPGQTTSLLSMISGEEAATPSHSPKLTKGKCHFEDSKAAVDTRIHVKCVLDTAEYSAGYQLAMAADRSNHSHVLPVPWDKISRLAPQMTYTISRLGGETRSHPPPKPLDAGGRGKCASEALHLFHSKLYFLSIS